MKILFINLPYHGHVVPTIGLVQELIKQDCKVTYLMPYDWEEKIAESGAEFYGYKNHRKLSEQIKDAYTTAESIVEQFDLIIYEQFFFLGKHLAEKHNKPVVRIFTAPVTNEKLMKEFITPMVVIPFTSDQPVNACCVEKLGVGKKLNYSDIKGNVLKDTVFSVLTDSEIKNNMVKIQRLIKEAHGNRGGAEFIINYCRKT